MSEWNFIPIRWVLSATKDDRFDTFTEAMLAATKALFVGCAKALGVNATGNKLVLYGNVNPLADQLTTLTGDHQ